MTITTLITDRGRAILAARVPGDPPLASIKIAVGDGNGAFPTPLPAQVALVNERWRGAGAATVTGSLLGFVINIPATVGGWNIREIGVFVGPAGAEELAVVSQFDGRYKPASGENGASSLTPVVYIDYSGSVVGAFTITLDPSLNPIDPSVHRTVDGVAFGAPPSSPPDGMVIAIAASATGAFAGRGGQIAKRRGTAWVYETPLSGHVVRDSGTGSWWHKIGADYVGLLFPFAAHAHDDRYHTRTEVSALLNGYVQKAGDSMSGPLRMSYNVPATLWGEAGGAWRWAKAANVGASGPFYLEHSTDNFAANATVALIALPNGYVGIGGLPSERFDVHGSMILRGNMGSASAAGAYTLGGHSPDAVTAGGYVQMYGGSHPTLPGRVALGSGSADRIAIRGGGALELSGGLGGPGSIVTANGAGIAVWGSMLALGLTQEIGAVDVRGGIIETAGCLCSAIGTDGNRSETIYQITLNPASGVGNAAQYRVFGMARQYAGQQAVYAPNGELSGYVPVFDTATIADQVSSKSASSFVIQANGYLSLRIYKVV